MDKNNDIFFDVKREMHQAIQILNQVASDDKEKNKFEFIEFLSEAMSLFTSESSHISEIFKEIHYYDLDKLKKEIIRISRIKKDDSLDIAIFHDLSIYIFELLVYIRILDTDIFWKHHSTIDEYIQFFIETQSKIPEEIKEKISEKAIYAPIAVAREVAQHPSIEWLREFSLQYKKHEEFKINWENDFRQKKQELNALSQTIKNLKSEYNFVGLVHGFEKIKKQKKEEGLALLLGMLFLSMAMIIFPAIISYNASVSEKITSQNYAGLAAWVIPAFTIEILILYYFRIFLQQYKSLQAQMLQIDLRVSLCQFIESYINYKKENKIENDASISKFESVIFSSIVSESGSIPSTFEGIDQISKLLTSFKSKT